MAAQKAAVVTPRWVKIQPTKWVSFTPSLTVLNRVRPLTLEMIRRLATGLKLPAEILIRGYELQKAA